MSELITTESSVDEKAKMFELAQRQAKTYAVSTLVPKDYQNNIGNVMIAQNMAKRMNADVLMVMQNLYVVHGRPSWSAQFLIACFNSCGRFTAIQYRIDGAGDNYGCVAYTTELASGSVIEGPRVSLEMAKAEGWSTKTGSKWKTMPELMLRYRSATFLIRTTAPEIAMGISTADEVEDVYDLEPKSYRKKEAAVALIEQRKNDDLLYQLADSLAEAETVEAAKEVGQLYLGKTQDVDLQDKIVEAVDKRCKEVGK